MRKHTQSSERRVSTGLASHSGGGASRSASSRRVAIHSADSRQTDRLNECAMHHALEAVTDHKRHAPQQPGRRRRTRCSGFIRVRDERTSRIDTQCTRTVHHSHLPSWRPAGTAGNSAAMAVFPTPVQATPRQSATAQLGFCLSARSEGGRKSLNVDCMECVQVTEMAASCEVRGARRHGWRL